MIDLIKDTIDENDISYLIEWLKSNPQLTKGKQTIKFEELWSKVQKINYSVFVNSGSSANLAMIYVLKISKRSINKTNKIVVPCVAWATTLSPIIQLGYTPILCETDKETLGLDVDSFEKICIDHKPEAVIVTHILGFANKMKEIKEICDKYDVIILEDSCESVGSVYNGINLGNFGLMSSFSFYFGHHISTIEGGMVCTNDKELYNILKMIRSHGWTRDLEEDEKKEFRIKYNISDFEEIFTFYYPSFNIRSTDLQAFLGIKQLLKLQNVCNIRFNNFLLYQKLLKNDFWKISSKQDFISNFAYPIIHPKRNEIVKALNGNNIKCRPLVCGSLSKQPFYYDIYGKNNNFYFADIVHNYGLYVPNHPHVSEDDIRFICNIINKVINND